MCKLISVPEEIKSAKVTESIESIKMTEELLRFFVQRRSSAGILPNPPRPVVPETQTFYNGVVYNQ